jgi:hypothetical protein
MTSEKAESSAPTEPTSPPPTTQPESYIPGGTAEEQQAFGRLVEQFQGKVLPFEPNGQPVQEPIQPRAIDDPILDEPDPGVLVPVDFPKLIAEGVPETEWLEFPYIARGARHWLFGPAESAKSIYMQWLAAKLTREGRTVTFFSAENPLATDLDRMTRLGPDFGRLRYFHMPATDLNERADFLKVAEACGGADLVILDTLSALWSGDENSNKEIVALDREILVPLVRVTGAAVVVIHHTGHPQAFISRGGASAGRGGSAMGQKADIVMVFTSVGLHEFTIDHGKNRTPGGHKEPKVRFQVLDTEDGGLQVEALGRHIDERVAECMDAAVDLVTGSDGTLGTNALKTALNAEGFGGSTVAPALRELGMEDPPRIRQADGLVVGADGKRRKGKPWTVA